jgi:hypothetical protein
MTDLAVVGDGSKGRVMTNSLRVLFIVPALLATMVSALAQQPDPRVADLVQAGKIRVGLHLPQFVRTPSPARSTAMGPGR